MIHPLAMPSFDVYGGNMADKDNSVNIELRGVRDSYHHGDLRGALIAAGMEALDGTPVDQLSLRALARTVGVSATAVYRHFPDKAALLGALGGAAMDELWRAQTAAARAAQAAGGGPMAAFGATGAAYVRFALAHPACFELIWQNMPPPERCPPDSMAVHPAMRDLKAGIDAILPDAASEQRRTDAALACWALVHGLATLALQGQVRLDDATIGRVIAGGVMRIVETEEA